MLFTNKIHFEVSRLLLQCHEVFKGTVALKAQVDKTQAFEKREEKSLKLSFKTNVKQ